MTTTQTEQPPVADPAADVLYAHRTYSFGWGLVPTTSCECDHQPRTKAEYAAHLGDALRAAGVLRDEATVKAEALREAADDQRAQAALSRTRDGHAEHETFADWLDERRAMVDGTSAL